MCSVGRMLGSSTSDPARRAPRAVADDRVEERAANAAARVLGVVVAPDEQRVRARHDLELATLDPGERLEGDPVEARQFEQWQFAA